MCLKNIPALIIAACILLIRASIFASISIAPDTTILDIGKDVYLLEDPEHKHTIQSIIKSEESFIKSTEDVPYYGFTESAYWVRFDLTNKSSSSNWILELGYPLMDFVDFYCVKDEAVSIHYSSGYREPFIKRPVKYRNFAFPLTLEQNSSAAVYMRFENEDRMEIPLQLTEENTFNTRKHNEQYVMGGYTGIVIFILFFNLLLFINIRDKSYLYYIFFVFSYGFFQLTQSGYFYEYFTPVLLEKYNHNIPFSIALALVSFILLTKSFLDTKQMFPFANRYLLIMIPVTLSAVALQVIVSYPFAIQAQMIISLLILPVVLYIGVKSLLQKYRPARFFMIAWTAMLIGGIIYALKVAGLFPSSFFTNYSILIGSVINFILLSFGLGDRINVMRVEKEKSDKEVLFTAKKFDMLIEGSDDMIFTLDEEWNILSFNQALKKHFKVNPEEIKNRNLIDLVYDENNTGVIKNFVMEKLKLFRDTGESVVFRAPFISPFIGEPKEFQIRLEHINFDGRTEILGKASGIQEDSLLDYFESEHQQYKIKNSLITAEEISHRLTRNLNRFIPNKTATLIKMALREIVINAIEHGNLQITCEEKTRALMNDNYFELLQKRQRSDEHRDKRVHIAYKINNKKAVYRITDEGQGFDYKSFIEEKTRENNKEMLANGRGITISSSIFDKIRYNEKGNQVLLVKYLNQSD
ncbi:MAG: ATP-binding protein [Spirochaetes bacterium]|nr:ATP-binding protein [Spirochaetota bacterium]MBN2769430.1 ATP-binding protein [Spirochaetota bacterium]